ncbi:MAG: hypothetical protein HAW65_04010 [Alphaproteobacteria bacterium]|nr:hypothetical protein [Alphaproteobacteria bacterium]MBE8220453.1 hypothetical protein [Alphaproteobacteria bacterium]
MKLFHFLCIAFICTTLSAPLSVEAASPEYTALSQKLVEQATQLLNKKDTTKANNILNLALTADPANARAYIIKGQAMRLANKPAEGLRLITIGLEIEPLNVEGLILQGQAALDVKDFKKAQASFKQAAPLCMRDCPHAAALVEGVARMNTKNNE